MRRVFPFAILVFMLSLPAAAQRSAGGDDCRGKQKSGDAKIEFMPPTSDAELFGTKRPSQALPEEPTPKTAPEPPSKPKEIAAGAMRKRLSDVNWAAVFSPTPKVESDLSTAPIDPTFDDVRDPYLGKPQDFIYTWAARNLAHRTLYYQDMPLERYGQTYGGFVQPLVSGLRFAGDIVTLPLQAIRDRPCQLHYVLGLERPGNCSPALIQRLAPKGR